MNTDTKKIWKLLYEYQSLVNFDDNMEKNNFKFMESYVKYHLKTDLNDLLIFLEDGIHIFKRYKMYQFSYLESLNNKV